MQAVEHPPLDEQILSSYKPFSSLSNAIFFLHLTFICWHKKLLYSCYFQPGLASLSFRRSSVINNYTAMVMAAYIRACGRKVVSYDIEYTDTLVEEDWVIV